MSTLTFPSAFMKILERNMGNRMTEEVVQGIFKHTLQVLNECQQAAQQQPKEVNINDGVV